MNYSLKNVIIVSSIKIYQGNSAGAARLMNIAKALASQGVNIYLCSSKLRNNLKSNLIKTIETNIYLIGEELVKKNKYTDKLKGLLNIFREINYLRSVNKIVKNISGGKVFYLYPTTEIAIDIATLLYLKLLCGYSVYYDMNELRKTGLYNKVYSRNYFKKFYEKIKYLFDYFKYSNNEKMARFYNGIIVISTSLEKYFLKFNKNILRVPILSDVTESYVDYDKSFYYNQKFKIGFAGQVSLLKEGFDVFYRALSILKDNFKEYEVNLYGTIDKNEKELLLIELPNKYEIQDNIIYHGLINQKVLINELRKNHLLVLPRTLNQQTLYGFSTKLSEYLVSGIPILVTDVSDNALFIKDGFNGFVVNPGEARIMAEKFLYIIKNYNKFVKTISKNAFDTALDKFNYINYGSIINNFLK